MAPNRFTAPSSNGRTLALAGGEIQVRILVGQPGSGIALRYQRSPRIATPELTSGVKAMFKYSVI
jgi:hypothetical protein